MIIIVGGGAGLHTHRYPPTLPHANTCLSCRLRPVSQIDLSSPLRLGIAGLRQVGRFHVERWFSGDEVRVVAGCDVDPGRRSLAEPLCGRIVGDLDELLSLSDLDAVLLDVPLAERAALGQRILAAQRNLIVEPPIARSISEAAALFSAARELGGRVFELQTWCDDADFAAAHHVVHSGLLGELRLIRFERWEAQADPSASQERDEPPLRRAAVAAIDQLVCLTDRLPELVYAVSLPGAGVSIAVRFSGGSVALVTIHAAAATRLDHGWAIDGERGGYAAGRRWIRNADGEIYHVSASKESESAPREKPLLSEILRAASQRKSLRLIALLSALDASLQTGRVVAVDQV